MNKSAADADREMRLRELWTNFPRAEILRITGWTRGQLNGLVYRLALGKQHSTGRPPRELRVGEGEEIRERLARKQSITQIAKALCVGLGTLRALMDQAEIERPPMKKRMRGWKPPLARPAPVHADSPWTFRFPDSQEAANADLEPAGPATATDRERPPEAAPEPAGPAHNGRSCRSNANLQVMQAGLRPGAACQWPSGDKGRFHFLCDEPAKKDRPYCADHCKLAYESDQRKTQ